MARWIYSFREAEERELAPSEKAALRHCYAVTRWRATGRGCGAALSVIPFVIGISILTDHRVAGWCTVIASLIISLWLFSTVGDGDRLALIYRRGARIGRVREWQRDDRSKWHGHASSVCAGAKPVDAEDDLVEESVSYWEVEERFERDLERAAGGQVERFETIGDDGVILTIEGKFARRVIEAPILDKSVTNPAPNVSG